MSSVTDPSHFLSALRAHCSGVLPLTGRLQPWMADWLASPSLLHCIEQFGSPLNLVTTEPMKANIGRLRKVALSRDVDFQIFFARKANKCLCFVDAAREEAIGIDTASEAEVDQTLRRGFAPANMICTAAVKSQQLVDRCLLAARDFTSRHLPPPGQANLPGHSRSSRRSYATGRLPGPPSSAGITITVDNWDEIELVSERASALGVRAAIAVRLGGFRVAGEKLKTRFGFDVEDESNLIHALEHRPLDVVGLHFHLDGCQASHRIAAIHQSMTWLNRLRKIGHTVDFIDMGGGLPMSYLESEQQWHAFWRGLRAALRGECGEITRDNHSLGMQMTQSAEGAPIDGPGNANCYPHYQRTPADRWLASILDAPSLIPSSSLPSPHASQPCVSKPSQTAETISQRLRREKVQLRCEPGRSLLDGCGITVARVEFTKCDQKGDLLVGLSMNGTQCRTSHDDFLVDPIVVPTSSAAFGDDRSSEALLRRAADGWKGFNGCRDTNPIRRGLEGYLVGAYCTEFDFLSWRRFRFPKGIRRGDLVAFVNTAGYLMHFMESRSHQFPLARNLVIDRAHLRSVASDMGQVSRLDDIDR